MSSLPSPVVLLVLGLARVLPVLVGVRLAWRVASRLTAGVVDLTGIVLLALLLAAALLVRGLMRRRLAPTPGFELTRGEHPVLWSDTETVAAAVGAEPPSRIVLTDATGVQAKPVAGGYEVVLGLPALAAFGVGELRAALAHELSHLAPPRLSGPRQSVRAIRTLHETAAAAPAVLKPVFALLARAQLAVLGGPAQEAEYAADAAAAAVVGRDVAAESLRMAAVTRAGWAVVQDRYRAMAHAAGRRASLVEAIRQVLGANAAQLVADLERPPTDPADEDLDSHPGLNDRLAALGAQSESEPVAVGPTPPEALASALLGRGDWTLTDAESLLFPADAPSDSWRAISHDTLTPRLHEQADVLVRRFARVGSYAEPSWYDVVEAACANPWFGAQVLGAVQGEGTHKATVDALEALVVSMLVRCEKAAVVESWSEAVRLVRLPVAGREEYLEPRAVIEAALDSPNGPKEIAAWVAEVTGAVGRGPATPAAPVVPAASAGSPAPVAVVAAPGPGLEPAELSVVERLLAGKG